MSATGYTIVAYAVGLGLLWGYAAMLWLGERGRAAADDEHGEAS